jgi:hypothetical protein
MTNHASDQPSPERLAAEIRWRTDQLNQFNLRLRRQLEVAELLIPKLNRMLDNLQPVQFADNVMFSAGIVFLHPYEPGHGPADSTQTSHAVLRIPDGIGALILDSEELYLLEQQCPGNPVLPKSRFVGFDECPDGVKAVLLPKVPELLDRLFLSLAIDES